MEGKNPGEPPRKSGKYPDKEGQVRMLGLFAPAPFMVLMGVISIVAEMYITLNHWN